MGRPTIVCLIGSTRFRREYERAFYEEEHAGRICLTCPCFKDDPCCKTPEDHARLDALHRAKIDLADEVYCLNVGGYVGESTMAEIAYATARGKRIRYLFPYLMPSTLDAGPAAGGESGGTDAGREG